MSDTTAPPAGTGKGGAASAAVTPAAPGNPAAPPASPGDGVTGKPATLDVTAASFRSATSFLELMRSSSRFCARLLDCQTARIWVSRRDGARLVARDFPEDGPPVVHRIGRGQGLAGWVIAHGKPLRLRAGETVPGLDAPFPAYRSALVVPLVRRGMTIAAIECLDPRDGRDFADADQERLEVAAEHIALAVDNALLVEQSERRALEKDALFEIAKSLSRPFDLDEVIEAMLHALREVVEYDAAAVYLVEKKTQSLETVKVVGYPDDTAEVFGLRVGVGIIGWVAKTGEPVLVADVSKDPRYVAARAKTRSELAVPLVVEGRTIGVFNLESDRLDVYHEDHLELVTAVASQAAVAVERARLMGEQLERRRLEKEIAIARQIQASFLPERAPEVPGFEFAGTARPHDQVGGDYYDYIRVSENRLGLAIADVSGKGIPAALIMAGFRMSLLAEIRNEFAIRAIMRKVNELLYESTDRGKFVTAFYGLLDTTNRVLQFTNAGHNPPLLLRRDTEDGVAAVEALHEGGLALGVQAESLYEDRPIPLRTGDVLVLYTDGVTEAENEMGELFGQRRLERLIAGAAELPAAEIVQAVVDEVLAFTGEIGPNDDLTLMVVKVLPPPNA